MGIYSDDHRVYVTNPHMRTTILTIALGGLIAACSSSSNSPSTPSGTGGSSSAGGRGGSNSGSGGAATGGASASGGAVGSGGSSSSGGSGAGGSSTGGSSAGGSGGDASGGAGPDDAGAAGAGGGDTSAPPSGGDGSAPPSSGDGKSPSHSPITEGFTLTPFTFEVQSPYKTPRAERYSYDAATDTHICWVKSDDSSFQAGNGTDPRTELRWQEEWTSGKHMFESEVWIAATTDRTNIVQVFSTNPPTTFMLTAWKDRTLRYYFGTGNGPVIMTDAFEKWFNLKVLHDVATHQVTVFINDVKSMSFADKGNHWHFKNGNYGCRSERCETRWKNIRYWVKN
jgi:hypothetical protein